MQIFIAILLYVGIIIFFVQNWLLLAIFCTVTFSVRYGALALIPLAIVLDGYFGNFYGVPYLSLMSVVWYIITGYMQPKLINFKV
jgi:hypothetical protein